MITIQVAIERRERTNSRGETYSQYFRDGKLVGCGCAEAVAVTIEKYNFKPCSHIRNAQATESITSVDLVPHVEDDRRSEYEGCDYCGCNHKWWNCPF